MITVIAGLFSLNPFFQPTARGFSDTPLWAVLEEMVTKMYRDMENHKCTKQALCSHWLASWLRTEVARRVQTNPWHQASLCYKHRG
jgi:hypothetical protein